MKKSLIIFCSLILVSTVTVFAFNRDKGPARQTDGIAELPTSVSDSLFRRGKDLLEQSKFNQQDLKAISVYLNNR